MTIFWTVSDRTATTALPPARTPQRSGSGARTARRARGRAGGTVAAAPPIERRVASAVPGTVTRAGTAPADVVDATSPALDVPTPHATGGASTGWTTPGRPGSGRWCRV